MMADDMGYECVTANGGESYKTPNLDQLAKTGVRFEHCYSQPICTPSRVQIMTGKYNSDNYIAFGILDPKATTFGNILHDAGYATCIAGKWQLKGGFEGPHKFGFDEYCLWQLTRRPNRYPNPGFEVNGKEVDYKNGEYGPDIVNAYALDFIDRAAKGDKPFFLYYPMMLTHWPFEPTPDSKEWDPMARRNDKSEKSGEGVDDKYFADMVAYCDKMVGKVIAKLDAAGVRENTLFIFTGDNGTYHSIKSRFRGREWIGGKSHMMDNGTHVSMIANWPGSIPRERVITDLVDFSDVLPTLADTAGVKVPEHLGVTGRSYLPQMRGEVGHPREFVYCWYFRNGKLQDPGKDHSAGESARTHRYKLYRTGEFYDVPADFYETSPLDPNKLTAEQREVRDRLRSVINQYTREGFYASGGRNKKNKQKDN
ncbi:MAG: sulfatase-like hydrolase/transferase [Phycisphaera sp.]|nr:sulfatase-like hydrolase/transferase [Phycisphaera sp.]